MSCGNNCACVGVNELFNEKEARKSYKRYLRKGPHKVTKMLLEALKKEDISDMTMVDIGGGLGGLHHALIQAGVRKATDVDGSEAYIAKSKEEAKRLGHEEKLEHHFGDYVEQANRVGEADLITLDKVICCYKDMRELVGRSSSNARKLYGVVYPLDRWWVRAFSKVGNVFVRLKSKEFQGYVHNEEEIEAIITGNGFTRRFYKRHLLWQIIVYGK